MTLQQGVLRVKNLRAVSTEDPEVSERFDRVLQSVVDGLEHAEVRYLFIGGVASGGLGRPRSTTDIDIFVRPEDAERALRALARQGFETQKTDPVWLYKAFKENILVDVIFRSKGEVYLDPEMYQRMTTAEFHGKKLRLVSPEDLLIIKVLAHSEVTPGHWHDALALLSHAEIDWAYLLKRARKAPRRLLSLMIYAQSNDLFVPNSVVSRLYEEIFGSVRIPESTIVAAGLLPERAITDLEYRLAGIREKLAQDERSAMLDLELKAEWAGGRPRVMIRGQVMSVDCREAIDKLVREAVTPAKVLNQLEVIGPAERQEPR